MASMRKTIAAAVLSAFVQVGDIAVSLVYSSINGQPTVDLVSGTPTISKTDYTIPKAVFTKIKEAEMDNQDVTENDMKVLFPKQYMAKAPDTSDYMTDPDGRVWQVKQVYLEPSGTLTVLRVRAS